MNFVENSSGEKIKALLSDNAKEYKSEKFNNFCKEKGIFQKFSTTYSPNQNGVLERINRTLVESMRSMLAESGVSHRLWAETLQTAAYIKNRSPHAALKDGVTPEEMWTRKKPDISHLRVFGCRASVLIPEHHRKSKFSSKVWWGTFVGYAASENGYRI